MKHIGTEEQEAICRTQWFKDHKANVIVDDKHPLHGDTIVIGWQNPESWNYGCRFIIHRRWLTVIGDIGEAIYEWSQSLTLEFLAGLDFGYFHGKCQSSETGRNFVMWNGDLCVPALKDFLKDDEREDKAELLEEAELYTSDEKEWVDFIYRGGHELRDDDYSLADAGEVPHARAIGHFVGLQMAIEQLKQKP